MSKLDVVAKAGPGFVKAHSKQDSISVEVSVSRADDGTPVTGLPAAAFEIWQSFSSYANTTGAKAVNVYVVEKAVGVGGGAPALGPAGVYGLAYNFGEDTTWGPEGVYFIDVTVADGSDVGQTVASFYLPS